MHGVYLPRTRKHRYAFILDKKLKCLYDEKPHPTIKGQTIDNDCCMGSYVVYDDRYNEYFTCPKCTSKMVELSKQEYEDILSKKYFMNKEDLLNYVEGIIDSKKTWDEKVSQISLW